MQGIDCSQVVAGYFSEVVGANKEQLMKASAAFGGGMNHGETCGAVVGATMVLGMKYGDNKPTLIEKAEEFRQLFTAKYGTCICKELLKYDISKEEEKAEIMEEGLLFSLCPKIVKDTIEMLEDVMK